MPGPVPKIDCDQAQVTIRAIVRGEDSNPERMALRHHVQACEGCHSDYVGSMGTLASLGHEKRLDRAIREKAIRKFELKRSIEAVAVSKKLSRGRLRTLAYPAFFAIMMLALAGRLNFGGGPSVLAQSPGVWVRGHELETDAGEARIKVGEVMHTGPEGQALISVGETEWRMRGQCALRLEGVANPTMRLAEGNLEMGGPARCLTRLGVIRGSEGSVVLLQLTQDALGIQIAQGAATFIAAHGETELLTGQSWSVDAGGNLLRE
ncbi:MAG: hypothetical protein GY930_05620 [bacterium]|nr:hypothetical protein [bacterium]